jgi:hypothetical protein
MHDTFKRFFRYGLLYNLLASGFSKSQLKLLQHSRFCGSIKNNPTISSCKLRLDVSGRGNVPKQS